MSKSSIINFVRGGQMTFQNLRMIAQIVRKIILILITVFVLFNAIWFFSKTTHYDRYVYSQWLLAHIHSSINVNAKQLLALPFFVLPNYVCNSLIIIR